MRCVCSIIYCFIISISFSYAQVKFTDVTDKAGIDFHHFDGRTGDKYLIETLGSGAVFLDYDSDGAQDLYVVNASNIPLTGDTKNHLNPTTNILYRNNGDGTFSDVTMSAGVGDTGYGVGCAAADINNDGYPEIYVTNYGINRLYLNNGNGTFTDISVKAGVGDKRWGTGCAFLDYDLDGYIDLYVVNYMQYSINSEKGLIIQGVKTYGSPTDQIDINNFKSESDILYRNNRDGTFTDVTKQAGINHRALGLAVAVGDYDNDGDPDIHIANDMEPDLLYQNNGDGTFTDITDFSGTGYDENGMPGSGMGSTFGDYDNDGFLDLVVSNASSYPVILYQNENALYFSDISYTSGVGAVTLPYFKWAVEFFDYNNDGLQDLYVSNGHLQDNISLFSDATYPQEDLLFQNTKIENKHTFTNVSTEVGLSQHTMMVGRGAVFGDYDNDGDIDIFLNHSNQPAKLLRNDGSNKNNWITIQTIGTKSNASGIGTRIKLTAGDLTQMKEVHSGTSYLSQNDLRLHFGLNKNTVIDKLELNWPSGKKQQFTNLKANQILQIHEEKGLINAQQ